MKILYKIMHGEKETASIDTQGHCQILDCAFLPFGLCLDDSAEDVDTLVNNITNFYFWCASRIFTLDRKYAKAILNSIGFNQAVTDRERAQIALSYHCVSLTDIFWVKKAEESVSFSQVNLFENHLDNAFVDVSLRGKQLTISNHGLVRDVSTGGLFPKAWLRAEEGFLLLKGGDPAAVENEILASRICQCFQCSQVIYHESLYEGEKVSVSKIMTSLEQSIVSREAYEIYALNHDLNALDEILKLDAHSFYMMNILDYLVGNTDRHWGNWGLLVDNRTNTPSCLHPLMDFNQAFQAYDRIEGASCLPLLPAHTSQMDAALIAVKQVGLNQLAEIDRDWFGNGKEKYGMFSQRLSLLRQAAE